MRAVIFLWRVFSLFLFLTGWEFRVNSLQQPTITFSYSSQQLLKSPMSNWHMLRWKIQVGVDIWKRTLECYLLGFKTLGTKCIRISMCNVLANHDQNLESRFKLLKVCLCVKLESSDYRIYWTKFAKLDRLKIRLDWSNLVQIFFSCRIFNSAQAHMTCRVLCFASSIKGKTLNTF